MLSCILWLIRTQCLLVCSMFHEIHFSKRVSQVNCSPAISAIFNRKLDNSILIAFSNLYNLKMFFKDRSSLKANKTACSSLYYLLSPTPIMLQYKSKIRTINKVKRKAINISRHRRVLNIGAVKFKSLPSDLCFLYLEKSLPTLKS